MIRTFLFFSPPARRPRFSRIDIVKACDMLSRGTQPAVENVMLSVWVV
jgi:hypothetical protein